MAIEKPADVTKFDESQVPILGAMMDKLFTTAAAMRYTNVVPTSETVHEGEIVIYDNAGGTKRIYVITGEGNLGYVALT